MNGLNIGENILSLRKKQNMTQEQLAARVGITAGAVSKWEHGASVPDIMLLAPLARALHTSIDELLSFEQQLSEEQLTQIKQELTQAFMHQSYCDAKTMCEGYLKEYPNSIGLKLFAASLLHMYAALDGVGAEQVKQRMGYTLSLLDEVVKSSDAKFRQAALFILADIQMKLGNEEPCQSILKELFDLFIDPTILQVSLYEQQGKTVEAEKLCKQMLLHHLNQVTAMLTILARLCKDTDTDQSKLFLNACTDIEDMFQIGLASGCYQLCQLYRQQGNKHMAAGCFKKYAENIMDAHFDYSENTFFQGIKIQVDAQGQKTMRKKLISEIISEFELCELTGIADFNQAISQLKAYAPAE